MIGTNSQTRLSRDWESVVTYIKGRFAKPEWNLSENIKIRAG